MTRIDEDAAAKAYIKKLAAGVYPLERSKNYGVNYCKIKEERDTEAVREFMASKLFADFKEIN